VMLSEPNAGAVVLKGVNEERRLSDMLRLASRCFAYTWLKRHVADG
jgi:hypothetical protein